MASESTATDWLGAVADETDPEDGNDRPSNWGRWGDEDELGALNLLTEDAVLAGIEAVSRGAVFTLGLPIAHPEGDPVWPGRHDADHHMVADHGDFLAGKLERASNNRGSDDVIYMFTHGTTHFDALGHVWYGDALYNGFDLESTIGGLDRCGIEHQAAHGIVGRGVLLDVARHRGVDRLPAGSRITLEELKACADAQDVAIHERDIINVRTGVTELWYDEGPAAYRDAYFTDDDQMPADLPGITYSSDVIEWFAALDIPAYCTDTIGFEQTVSDVTGTVHPLHRPLIRDLGVAGNELSNYRDLAADCADDGQWEFLYVAAPLGIVGGTGGPVNPVAIK
ncbi:MAG: cyclase family protein [Halobacteriales archaeon]|nr:cyclase family protein [Halobacteriales archaeon]